MGNLMADNDKILIEELEKRLVWYRDEASEEEFDTDEVDAICTMLQKLSPIEPSITREEAYQSIMRRLRLENGEKEPNKHSFDKRRILLKKRGMRAAVIFLAVAGVLTSLNIVTYAREEKSLFTIIFEKVGWIEVEKERRTEDFAFDGGEQVEGFYESWADLDHEVKKQIIVPEYIPEEYSLYGIRTWKAEDKKIVQADYYDRNNKHLLIEVTIWLDNKKHFRETLIDETKYKLLSEYSDKNTMYYEYEDEYVCIAFRKDNTYRINGNIPAKEIIKMGERLGSAGRR